jgi:hypothetical protein
MYFPFFEQQQPNQWLTTAASCDLLSKCIFRSLNNNIPHLKCNAGAGFAQKTGFKKTENRKPCLTLSGAFLCPLLAKLPAGRWYFVFFRFVFGKGCG